MGRPTRATMAKRDRERSKQEKQQEKREQRALRKELKKSEAERGLSPGEDPDLAGIVPGPQPPIEF